MSCEGIPPFQVPSVLSSKEPQPVHYLSSPERNSRWQKLSLKATFRLFFCVGELNMVRRLLDDLQKGKKALSLQGLARVLWYAGEDLNLRPLPREGIEPLNPRAVLPRYP